MEGFKKHSIPDYIVLYFRFTKMIMMSRMMYKWDTLLLSLSVLVRESVAVVTLYLILLRFSNIHDWNMGSLLFMYSLVFLTYSLCILIFTGVRDFEGCVHQGEFDGYLTKPITPLFHVIAKKSDVMASLGHGILGLLLFFYSFHLIGLKWSIGMVFVIIWLIIGGILIQGAILLVCAALTFWTTKSQEIQNIVFYQTRNFTIYPISIYPKVIQAVLTFVVPLGFVNYYPSRYLIHGDRIWLYISPLVGVVLFIFAYMIWKIGLLRYKSSGH